MTTVTKILCGTSDHRYYIGINGIDYKVPFRYNRIMCKVPKGLKTLWELEVGDPVSNLEVQKIVWNEKTYLVLKSINTCKEG